MTISDAELTALYGNGLHPDTAARVIEELRALRFRLTETETLAAQWEAQYAELERAEMARELTRDRHADEYMATQNDAWLWQSRAEAAESRLAAVRALCERNFNMEDHYEIDANDVAAILEGRAVLAAVDGPAEDRHEFVPKDVPAFSVFCSVCDSSKGHPIHRAAVDPPADHIAIFDGPPMRAAVDGGAEPRPCPHPEMDGYGRCRSCDEPAEGTNGDEGPYTEDQIRETFERLGDSTNQDDFMYNLRWGGPDWANFMKARPSTGGSDDAR